MSAYEQAVQIVANYIEALEELLEETGPDFSLGDIGVYGGETVEAELFLARQKLEDLQARTHNQ